MAEPQQADPEDVGDIADAFQAKVASRMRTIPVFDLVTTDEDSGDKREEASNR